jgi:succinate dehydrogenase/fumarate reductase-like Fe-S protein
MELIIGNYIKNIKCENFLDTETDRIRVRPLPNQEIPTDVVIECSKFERERHPVGTKFITIDVKVCKKPDGRIYLRARDQLIVKIS